MPIYLRQSTASQEVPLGPFLDSTDGNTEETGLTIANTDIKIWVNGATTLANKNSGGATHISNGIYYAVLDATDTATVGPLVIFCHPSGALATRVECVVLTALVFDSLIAGSDNLQVDLVQVSGAAVSTSSAQIGVNVIQAAGTAWGSGAITAGSIAADAITAAKIADGAIDAATFAASAITATSIASNAITSAKIATDAIGAAQLAADAVTEIQSGLSTLTASALLTTSLADVYAANGAQPTLQQAIMAIHQSLMNFSISGTSNTVKKLDGATTAFVVTLDSATSPTAATRA